MALQIAPPDMDTKPTTKAEAMALVESLRLYIRWANCAGVAIESKRGNPWTPIDLRRWQAVSRKDSTTITVVTPDLTYVYESCGPATIMNNE